MIWELLCWQTRRAQKHARELKPLFCFLNDFTRFIHRWWGAYVSIATLARWTRWSIKVRHADHEATRSSLSTSYALSNKDGAKRWTCQIISFREGLLRCCALRCKCTLKCEDRESLQVWTTVLLDYSTLQNSTPFTGCSKKLLKIKGRANLLAFYLLVHPWSVAL